MTEITYAALSKYPYHQREAILQQWLTQWARDLLGSEDDPLED